MENSKSKGKRWKVYDSEVHDRQVLKLCLLSATNEEIADFFGVRVKTLYEWMKKYPSFGEALKKGKEDADSNVASRLYNRAIGYDFKAIKFFKHNEDILKQEYIEHVPPDVTACIFWLKNRQPDKWRDRREVQTNVKIDDELENMSTEELQELINSEKSE
jgi:hypothetical protein